MHIIRSDRIISSQLRPLEKTPALTKDGPRSRAAGSLKEQNQNGSERWSHPCWSQAQKVRWAASRNVVLMVACRHSPDCVDQLRLASLVQQLNRLWNHPNLQSPSS